MNKKDIRNIIIIIIPFLLFILLTYLNNSIVANKIQNEKSNTRKKHISIIVDEFHLFIDEKNSEVLKTSGIWLCLLAIARIFVYDIAALETVYKLLAFTVLGIILMIVGNLL